MANLLLDMLPFWTRKTVCIAGGQADKSTNKMNNELV